MDAANTGMTSAASFTFDIIIVIIEMEVAGVVSRHPNNYTANGNPNAEP
jgi:hypothetical protein